MDVQNRLLRIIYSKELNLIIGSDVRGCIRAFDPETLEVVKSSPVVSYDRPVNAICLTENYILTKDRFGSIGKWDLKTLTPLDFLDGKELCDRSTLFENEEVSPSPNRGIAAFNGKLYTNNGYGQIVVLDIETFSLQDIRTSPSEVFIDCFCVDDPQTHALTDVVGNIYLGNLETNEWPIQKKIDTSVVHGVIYDKRHQRFWTTQDGGLGDDRLVRTGVTTIEKDGTGFQEFKISMEDNEFIACDPDCSYVFAGGFNGRISIFDNSKRDFCQTKVFGPLEFQIISAAVVSIDQIYVLLQTGDIIRLNSAGKEVVRTNYLNKCVWTLEPHPNDIGLLYAGTDEGVTILRCTSGSFGAVEIEEVDKHVHGRGIIKDVRPLSDNSYICFSRAGYAFKSGSKGEILWQQQVLGIPRGAAVNSQEDRCMISTDEGTVWELATADGTIIDAIPIGSASYACAYMDDGRRVVTADGGPYVHVFSGDNHDLLGSIRFKSRLKRLVRASNNEIFVVGPDGMFELDLDNFQTRKSFGNLLVSTKENGVLVDGHLYVGGYGYQVGTYRYSDQEIIHLQETLPDYTKAFAAFNESDGLPILLVGGRGGFLNAYRLKDGIPTKIREYFIR